MASLAPEKQPFPDALAAVSAPSSSKSRGFGPLSPLANVYRRFSDWRTSLGLPNPGSVEGLGKEVKNTHLTNFFFDGARADLMKGLSLDPAFQVTHSFSLASQTAPPSYSFGAVFANQNVFMQGNIDHEGNLNGRFNQGWSPNHFTKIQGSLSQQVGHNMIQIEQDYQGQDFSVNGKVVNPSPIDGSGIYIGSYLQSITQNLALGFESVYQRQADMSDLSTSYLAKYTGSNKDWIASAHIQPVGGLQATYWQKLSDKVDVAADLMVLNGPMRRDAVATLGAKWDLRMSTFRAQVDSQGKVAAVLENRFAPSFVFTITGEIDHFKNAAKVGVGVMIESTSLTPEEMGMAMPPPPGYP